MAHPESDTSYYPVHGSATFIGLPGGLLHFPDSQIIFQILQETSCQLFTLSCVSEIINTEAISTEVGNSILKAADSYYPKFCE